MARKPKKYHYIYKTTCKITGKFYVGMHSTDNLEDGYLGSGKILGYSRKKYGDENHIREILEFCSSRDELKQREKEIVCETLLADPLNINLKYGGDGGWDHLTKASYSKGGKAASKILNALFASGTILAKNRSRNSADAQRGKNKKSPIVHGWIGKKHSNQTKEKMRISQQGKQIGAANSQYGTCWVSNGNAIKIKQAELESYLSKGYRRGRK